MWLQSHVWGSSVKHCLVLQPSGISPALPSTEHRSARVQAAFVTVARQLQSEKLFLSIGLSAGVVQLPCPNREGS